MSSIIDFLTYIMEIAISSCKSQKELFAVLFIFVLADYLTEIFISISRKKINSLLKTRGLLKKSTIFIVLFLACVIDVCLIQNEQALVSATTGFFYISFEGLCVLKNLKRLGIPFPEILTETFNKLDSSKDKE